MHKATTKVLMLYPLLIFLVAANTHASLYTDRAAVERVYHDHRTGTKKPFEEAMPEAMIRQLVEKDLLKEHVLKDVYGITLTDSQIETEVNRINASTRAPEMLAEIKAALGNDPARFAETVVKPILVEKILRNKYENDPALHVDTRTAAGNLRGSLLAARSQNLNKQKAIMSESGYQSSTIKWKMGPPPEEGDQPAPIQQTVPVKGKSKGGRYSVESTVQVAQVLSSPEPDGYQSERAFYFEDLHTDLQRVLDIQLQNSGDVSALIERPLEFQLFLLSSRTSEEMEVISLSIPKHGYDAWLAQQAE